MAQTPPRPYQAAVRYLQCKVSALEALTRASRGLKEAYVAITVGGPSIGLLEKVHTDIELALREARGMANMDDAAVVRGEPAA
jgi:hypothetical protein